MSSSVINVRNVKNTAEELDNLLIPNEIYDLTISRNSDKIQEYFIDNPKLMLDFVGFNSTLKRSSVLSSDRKCGCFYTVPWVTKYADTNNLNKRLEKLSKDNNELRAKNDSYSKELKLALDELEQIIKDLGI